MCIFVIKNVVFGSQKQFCLKNGIPSVNILIGEYIIDIHCLLYN